MSQEYKIFYNDRVVILTSKITKTFEKNEGLFYKYQKKEELVEILNAFGTFTHHQTLYVLHDNTDELLRMVKSGFTIVEAAGGIIRRNDGKLLAIFRRGKWDLPKGKVEKGEFYKQTAIREVQEECGLTNIEIGNRLADTYHTYTDKGQNILKRTIWYEMQLNSNEEPVPQTEEDITEIKWFDYQTVSEIMKNTFESLKETIISQIVQEKI
jgi:8-oxo-dGTP pyrophosphatase MutT (NUDIX family)